MFKFIQYIKPEWYLFLPVKTNRNDTIYFPDYDTLPIQLKKELVEDNEYETEDAKKWDLAFQYHFKGIISYPLTDTKELGRSDNITLYDNYRFIFRFFNRYWSTLILAFRILTLHNPFKEVKAWSNARITRPVNMHKTEELIDLPEISNDVNSTFPTISIIIPTLNRYENLKKSLEALETQTCIIFEVIVIDQSDIYDEQFYKQFKLPLVIIRQEMKGQCTARNAGLKIAKGDLIAFYEDDVLVDKDWLENHIKCLSHFNADISAGRLVSNSVPNKPMASFSYAYQFPSGNAVIKRNILKSVGLFDKQYDLMRWEDGEFGLRCYLEGFKSIYNPYATCVDVKAAKGGLREKGSWDGFTPVRFFGLRPVPSVFYFHLKYFGKSALMSSLLLRIPLSFTRPGKNLPYRYFIGCLSSIVFLPYLIISISISYLKGVKMLKEGDKIDRI